MQQDKNKPASLDYRYIRRMHMVKTGSFMRKLSILLTLLLLAKAHSFEIGKLHEKTMHVA